VISASGLNDDNVDKNDGMNWKLAESFRMRNNIFTAIPLSKFSNVTLGPERASVFENSYCCYLFPAFARFRVRPIAD
jgi:hypothetical protein